MDNPLHIIMTGVIDYAGLFPPAGLDMPNAVLNFAKYHEYAQRDWLGRFVVPVGRLAEFQEAYSHVAYAMNGSSEGWPLSALAGEDLATDLKAINAFNSRAEGGEGVFIDSIEIKVRATEEIIPAMEKVPGALMPYFEIPVGGDTEALIARIGQAGGRVKVRTGGLTGDLFPSSGDLARILMACSRHRVAFKATAGLHHPFRSVNRLTYEAGSGSARMHGFLNLFVAAAFARNGASAEEVAELLDEEAPGAFAFDDGVKWRGRKLGILQLRAARERFAISFGCCSFEEPIQDLQGMGML